MNERAEQDEMGKELWRRYLLAFGKRAGAAGREQQAPLDANVLAAYLDGTAGPEEIELVEARMARDPALLEEIIELRAIVGEAPGVDRGDVGTFAELARAPESLPAGAKAIARGGVSVHPRPAALAEIVRTWWRRVQWSAAAAAVVLACLGGYGFGRNTFRDRLRAESSATAGAAAVIEELICAPDLTMPGYVNGGNGGES